MEKKEPWFGESFIGSSTIIVIIMDGWHLVKFLWLMNVFAAIVFYLPITNFFIVDIIIFYFFYVLGHELFSKLQKINTLADK